MSTRWLIISCSVFFHFAQRYLVSDEDPKTEDKPDEKDELVAENKQLRSKVANLEGKLLACFSRG